MYLAMWLNKTKSLLHIKAETYDRIATHTLAYTQDAVALANRIRATEYLLDEDAERDLKQLRDLLNPPSIDYRPDIVAFNKLPENQRGRHPPLGRNALTWWDLQWKFNYFPFTDALLKCLCRA